ncbi:MAG: type I DNA topoisomerase [Chloroflexi bacterium]|nr:type I DNA topoisomerase [Chloroflexota bacterium]
MSTMPRGEKRLVVVESPAKARTVGRFLGGNYLVKASLGHVRDLPKGKLGVEITDGFTPEYAVLKEKQSVISDLKKSSREVASVYLATDPDREGEAISWHLKEAVGWKTLPVHRVVFHEITQGAIQEAFRNPRDIDMRLVNAQQARRILDRLVGYQLSPLLWRKVQRGLSAGRVQSVAVRLVVDRERAIREFVPVEYWSIEATLAKHGQQPPQPFVAALYSIRGQKGKLRISDDSQASTIVADLEGASYRVQEVSHKEVRRRPAPPFITSTLQQEAWRKLRMPARRTMAIAQQLYEGLPLGAEGDVGLITYMRTDSTHVAASALRETQAYIRQRFGEPYTPKIPRQYTKKVKGAQEAHEAIRPTAIAREPSAVRPHLSLEQYRLYELVWSRMVASQMSDAVLDATQVDVDVPGRSGTIYLFRASGSVLRFPGFLALYREGRDEDKEEEDGAPLPELAKSDALDCLGLKPEQHFTQPPSRYTEATLIKALEERGIGRPSTYAPILATIVERSYIIRERGRLAPTALGEVVSDQLSAHFPEIMDPDFTAQMEEHLDEIARGERQWVPVLKEFYGPFSQALALAQEQMPRVRVEEPTDEVCEQCGRPMVVKTGRFGRFLSCSGFPECRNSRPLLQKTGVACPRCGGDLVQRRGKKGKGRTFYGCSNYPTCDFAVGQRPLLDPCPQCGGLLVALGRGAARCTQCAFRGPVPEREAVETGA